MIRHTVTIDADGDHTIECHHPADDVSAGWVGRDLTFDEITELAAWLLAEITSVDWLIHEMTSPPTSIHRASVQRAWNDLSKRIREVDACDVLHDILLDGAILDLPSGVSVAESYDGEDFDVVAVAGCVASHGDVEILGWGEIEPGTYELGIEYDGEFIAAIGKVGARIDDLDIADMGPGGTS